MVGSSKQSSSDSPGFSGGGGGGGGTPHYGLYGEALPGRDTFSGFRYIKS